MLSTPRDPFWDYVQLLPAFSWWRQTVDLVFVQYTGRSSYDLPIPDRTWRTWWTAGTWSAQAVGDVLSKFVMELDRSVKA